MWKCSWRRGWGRPKDKAAAARMFSRLRQGPSDLPLASPARPRLDVGRPIRSPARPQSSGLPSRRGDAGPTPQGTTPWARNGRTGSVPPRGSGRANSVRRLTPPLPLHDRHRRNMVYEPGAAPPVGSMPMNSGSTLMFRRSEPQSNRPGRPNHDKTMVQMPVPSRPGRRLSAAHASVGLPTGFQRPFEIPMRPSAGTGKPARATPALCARRRPAARRARHQGAGAVPLRVFGCWNRVVSPNSSAGSARS